MISASETCWFPMRVTYSREMTVKQSLEDFGIECFVPLRYVPIKGKHPRHQELKPAINNLIFVHSCRGIITELKMTKKELAPLRYMMRSVLGIDQEHNNSEIMTVPDKQMEDFIRVASVQDDRIFYIENLAFAGKPGQRVKVVEGDFSGVEGTIKRIKKNKCVVVQIENVAAVAIAFLPSAFLLPIKD